MSKELEGSKPKKKDKRIGCLSAVVMSVLLVSLFIGAAQLTTVSYNNGYVKGYEEAIETVSIVLTDSKGGTT